METYLATVDMVHSLLVQMFKKNNIMTQIKKILDKQGNEVFIRTSTKAVVDSNGYTAESRLQTMQDEINQAQLEAGAVPSDLTPTENSTNWVTSGGLYNQLNVGEANVDIDLSEYTEYQTFPTPSNKWITNNSSYQYFGVFVPITPGRRYRLIGNATDQTYYCLLTTDTHANGTNVSYATGCSREKLPSNENVVLEAPADALYLYLFMRDGNYIQSPQSVCLYNKETVVEAINEHSLELANIKDDIEQTKEDISNIVGAKENTIELAASNMYATQMYISDTQQWKKSINTIVDSALYKDIKKGTEISVLAQSNKAAYIALVDSIGAQGTPCDSRIDIASGSTYNTVASKDCLLWVWNYLDAKTKVFPETLSITSVTLNNEQIKKTRYAVNICNSELLSKGSLSNNGEAAAGNNLLTDYIEIDYNNIYCRTQYIHICHELFLSKRFGYGAYKVCIYGRGKNYLGSLSNIDTYIDKESNVNNSLFSSAVYIRVEFPSEATNCFVSTDNKPVLPQYSEYNKHLLTSTDESIYDKFSNTDGAINNMISTALSYVNADSYTQLGYGDSATAYDTTVEAVVTDPWNPGRYTGEKKQINCSTFVQLCLEGVRFENSRYVGGSSGINYGVNGYMFDNNVETNYHNSREQSYETPRFIPCSPYNKLYANKLLKYAKDRGFAYLIEEGFKNVEVGDVVFVSNSTADFYKNVGHTAFVSSISLASDGVTKNVTIMEVGGTGNNLAHDTYVGDSVPSTWVYAARFPLQPIASCAKNIIESVTKYSSESLSDNEIFILGDLTLSENVKAKGIYTAVVKCNTVGNFEILIGNGNVSSFTIYGSSGENLYKRTDGVTVKHFYFKYDSSVNSNNIKVAIKAHDNISVPVEIEDVKFFDGYVTL